MARCECGNDIPPAPGEEQPTKCDWCLIEEAAPRHTGHHARLSGAWWCDTCNSPYCELA